MKDLFRKLDYLKKVRHFSNKRSFNRFELVVVLLRSLDPYKEYRCELDDAFNMAWEKLVSACGEKERAIPSEIIVDFEFKLESIYDKFASNHGIMDLPLFLMNNRILIRLYHERSLIDTDGEMSFKNKEKILEIQS